MLNILLKSSGQRKGHLTMLLLSILFIPLQADKGNREILLGFLYSAISRIGKKRNSSENTQHNDKDLSESTQLCTLHSHKDNTTQLYRQSMYRSIDKWCWKGEGVPFPVPVLPNTVPTVINVACHQHRFCTVGTLRTFTVL